MADPTAYTYIVTNALPGGIALAMAGNGSVFTNSGLQNQHVWRFKSVGNGLFSISNGQSATTAKNGFVSGAGSGSGTKWSIQRKVVHGYIAHTIQQSGGNQGYWWLNPNRLSPGSQIQVVPKPPGAPDLNPAALWVFTSIAKSPALEVSRPVSSSLSPKSRPSSKPTLMSRQREIQRRMHELAALMEMQSSPQGVDEAGSQIAWLLAHFGELVRENAILGNAPPPAYEPVP
ncbi:hypothetical protein BD779DRAFT_1473481 [Infundibulicybe gibba]|nr:hypothetical protein BD779DRAFT_1473481 [Infundibulicybe gibba]